MREKKMSPTCVRDSSVWKHKWKRIIKTDNIESKR